MKETKKIQPELAKQALYLKLLPQAHTSAHKICKYSTAYAVYRAQFLFSDESCTTAKNAPLKFLRTDVSRKIFYNWYCESQCYAKASDTDAVVQRDQEPESQHISLAPYCSSGLCLDYNSKSWLSTPKIGFHRLFLFNQSFNIPLPAMKIGHLLNLFLWWV